MTIQVILEEAIFEIARLDGCLAVHARQLLLQ